jgi:tetratricopeptide (TPR) repeat protein
MRLLVGVAAVLACISLSVVRAAAPSRDWKRARTQNFAAFGNASETELRDTVRRVEAFRGALGAVFPGLAPKVGQPTTLVLLKNLAALTEFVGRDAKGRKTENVAGYFTPTPRGDLFVLGVSEGSTTLQTAYHEYVHSVLHSKSRELPEWVDEGVSDLYSTFEIDKQGLATIGRVPTWRRQTLRYEQLLPLREVVTPEGAARIRREGPEKVAVFYAEAWAFAHFLAFSDGHRRSGQLGVYLNEIESGKSPDAAFQDAFGGTYFDLENQLRAYLRLGIPGVQVRLDALMGPQERTATVVEPMTIAEAEGLQGCILLYVGSRDEADRHLQAALADDAADVQARGCLGAVRTSQGRHAEALQILEPLAASTPDPAVQYWLGVEYADRARYDDAIAAFSTAIRTKPDLVDAWFHLSVATLHLHRDAQSDAALGQVVGRGQADALRARASEALTLDRPDVTLKDARRYLTLRNGDETAVYVGFLGALGARRLNQAAQSDELLTSVQPFVDPKSWAGHVMAFFQGRIDAKAFMDLAHDDGQHTEAHTYIGFAEEQAGRIDSAKTHFQWVKDHGSRNYTEYPLAVRELRRLESPKPQ